MLNLAVAMRTAFASVAALPWYGLLMAGTDDDPSDEFGAFIGGDGHRLTDAPWRLQAYDQSGPLSASQISELAEQYGLEPDQLGGLSKQLGHLLNSSANIHVIPASRSKARQAAKSNVAFARKQLTAMRSKLSAVIERLSSLTSEDDDDDDDGESPYSQQYAKMLTDLQSGLESVRQAEASLKSLDGSPAALAKWEPLDKRDLYDRRRDEVLRAIFQFWVDGGRKLSFTTDPLTSKRHGELVSFAQALCTYLTDPPTEIAAETIVKKIREKGKSYQPTPEWARRFPTPEELRSVLNDSDE